MPLTTNNRDGPAVVETPLYDDVDGQPKSQERLLDYDMVLCTACDVNGSPRGHFVMKNALASLLEEGLEVPFTTGVLGFKSEVPTSVERYRGSSPASRLVPDVSTFKPISWMCQDGRKIGHVLCDLYTGNGTPDPHSPRQLALRQLARLRELGFSIMSAHETEYFVYHRGTLEPLGGQVKDVCNHLHMMGEQKMLYQQMTDLIASGVPIETFMKEYGPGQIEFSMEPQYGIKMADVTHRLRYLAKSVCKRSGFEPSFMTRPQSEFVSSGYHFNHSLWTLDGRNAFYDPEGDHTCSDVIRHWIAGLIKHGDALTCLYSPTVNCYERLHGFFAPTDNVWNYDDRNARLRVKTKAKNVHIEERTPSSACNPYLVLAGLLAAGMDGLVNKLECPPNREFRPFLKGDQKSVPINPLPKSLEESLEALREDEELKTALGEEFVEEYTALIQECQLDKLSNATPLGTSERFEAQRDLYFCM
ncbi:glutamine synthetase [Aplysia californica]|uniref:Lengsin n=1 Tax=Aplysia californica TaxID=6500 RepID=A0ABM0K738_APLCA|nr:glutamine synthetase [Aplysia californica]